MLDRRSLLCTQGKQISYKCIKVKKTITGNVVEQKKIPIQNIIKILYIEVIKAMIINNLDEYILPTLSLSNKTKYIFQANCSLVSLTILFNMFAKTVATFLILHNAAACNVFTFTLTETDIECRNLNFTIEICQLVIITEPISPLLLSLLVYV